MALDPSRYTGRSAYPNSESVVELVAYERKSGGWDAFIFEPTGVLPKEWEQARVDSQHVKVADLESSEQMDALAAEVAGLLGAEYEKIVAFRDEVSGRRVEVDRRLHFLHKKGVTGYSIRRDKLGHWYVWMRRRDLRFLEEFDERERRRKR